MKAQCYQAMCETFNKCKQTYI